LKCLKFDLTKLNFEYFESAIAGISFLFERYKKSVFEISNLFLYPLNTVQVSLHIFVTIVNIYIYIINEKKIL